LSVSKDLFDQQYFYLILTKSVCHDSSAAAKSKIILSNKTCSKSSATALTVYILGQYDIATFSFGTFDFFLAGLCRNQGYCAFCSAQMAYRKPF
jgi:hypothetical protein